MVFGLGSQAQVYSVLHHFASTDGRTASAPLTLSDSLLYGTTLNGGSYAGQGYGTAFALAPDGSGFNVIQRFAAPPGALQPNSALVTDGAVFYGTTYASYPSGYGTVFRMDTNGQSFGMLHIFAKSDGAGPNSLALAGPVMFGTTGSGGTVNNGTVFRMDTNGNGFVAFYHFSTSDGYGPHGPLVLSEGRLYGTLAGGTGGSAGCVFALQTTATVFTALKRFTGDDGARPQAGLAVEGATLYGTTEFSGLTNGSTYGYGTVFKVNTDGSGFARLKNFQPEEGCFPVSELAISGSRLYGTTQFGGNGYTSGASGYGVIYKLNKDGSGFLVLKKFVLGDGVRPAAGLLVRENTLYGTTTSGGASDCGTVFSLQLPYAPRIMTPPAEQVAAFGAKAEFSVDAMGVEPLAYQWTFNGTNPVPGGTSSSLPITDAQISGYYAVVITNVYGATTSAPALLRLIDGSTVTNCAEADLRAAMAQGGAITLAFDGTVTLTSTIAVQTNTSLSANGHHVVISGGDRVRLFYVAPNTEFSLDNLSLTEGAASEGAAVYNDGSTVRLAHVSLLENASSRAGGAICNSGGTVVASNCLFAANRVDSLQSPACGGAIWETGGALLLQDCVFRSNRASAGDSTNSGGDTNGLPAQGGAVWSTGLLKAIGCAFVENAASGGAGAAGVGQGPLGSFSDPGGSGGVAQGAAIYSAGSMAMERSVLAGNVASGGSGGIGAAGGFGPFMGGWGGTGGEAAAALYCAGSGVLVNCTVAGNEAHGGTGGTGGTGGSYPDMGTGQIIYMGGGFGGNGGTAFGAIWAPPGLLAVTNCTVAFNSSSGGAGGRGGQLSGGWGPDAPAGASGLATGALVATNALLLNSILSANAPANSVAAPLTDAGCNISSDSTGAFSHPSSRNNLDPRLAPLCDNGGHTLTAALLPGSPAIDSATCAGGPAFDQRGFPRPVGTAPDIGAYEYGSPALLTAAGSSEALDIGVLSVPGRVCELWSSPDLVNWGPLATNTVRADGTLLFHDRFPGPTRNYYRAMLP